MALPTSLTTVTRLSKTIALIMFIALPFIGFMFGVRWQEMLHESQQVTTVEPIAPHPTSSIICSAEPTIQSSTKNGWSVFIGKRRDTCEPFFSLEYPSSWQTEGYYLYPFGKVSSDSNPPTILISASESGWYPKLEIINRDFPAGIVRYSWGKPQNYNYIVGFATFFKNNGSYIIRVSRIPIEKDQEMKNTFDQILSTFKFLD